MTTADPTVRAVYEDYLLESGRALGSPRVVFGYGGYGDGYGGYGDGGYDGGGYGGGGYGDGYGYGYGGYGYGDAPTIWRRRD